MDLGLLVPAAVVSLVLGWSVRPREQTPWRLRDAVWWPVIAGLVVLFSFFAFDRRGWDLLTGPVFMLILVFLPPAGAWARRRWHPRRT